MNIPTHLSGYEGLYEQDPRAASVQWFRDAKFGLFVHYALASLLARGKPELLELVADAPDLMTVMEASPEELATCEISRDERKRGRH